MVSYPFSVLRIEPDPIRGESINMGLVIALNSGLEVRLAHSYYKLRVLHPLYDTAGLTQLVPLLKEMDALLRESEASPVHRLEALAKLGLCALSAPGYFTAETDGYEKAVSVIMDQLVNPPAPMQLGRLRFSRLESQIKKDFRKRGLLSELPGGIDERRVVHRYPILPDENLVADFAFRSDSMTVVAAVDFRARPETLRNDKHKQTAVKSIMLDRASALFKANPIALIAASDEQQDIASHSIKMLHDYAEQVYNILIPAQNKAFFDHCAHLIAPSKAPASAKSLH